MMPPLSANYEISTTRVSSVAPSCWTCLRDQRGRCAADDAPLASVPAVEMCSEMSDAGTMISASETEYCEMSRRAEAGARTSARKTTWKASPMSLSALTTLDTELSSQPHPRRARSHLIRRMICLAMA